MRVSREKFAETRDRILDTAARLFREKGFDGIGLGDIMKAAGLTHGGFYRHFGSKEDLEAQALSLAMARSLTIWSQTVDSAAEFCRALDLLQQTGARSPVAISSISTASEPAIANARSADQSLS